MTALDRLTEALADRYRIERELGAGGMATVYLARDLKHDRDVAIKVLKPELGAVLGVERFLSEIKVTANLQHPNLLPLFESGETEGLLFYVMPFIAGETLRARLERERQLPVDEVVRLSVAIAQALDFAHRRGVIHRDLKPENILLADGQPLVADFGIALAVSMAGGQRVTQTGLSLGTPQYMSPEQATGERTVDARTDIYSLGAMTYEMLAGEPPHTGPTAQAIIAKLVTEDVRPLTVLRRSVPPAVDAAVRHALEKLAADRFATAGEFAQALQGKGDAAALARYLPAAPVAAAPSMTRGRTLREAAAWAVAAAAVAGFTWTRMRTPAMPDTPVIRTTIATPANELVMVGGFPIALSPQGDKLAYVTSSVTGYRTVVQRVSDLRTRVVLAEGSLKNLAFSPNGSEVAYSDGFEIRRVSAEGGPSRMVANSDKRQMFGMVWAPDGSLIVGTNDGLYRVPAAGGSLTRIGDAAAVKEARDPALLPDGQTALVTSGLDKSLVAIDLTSGDVTDIGVAGTALGIVEGALTYLSTTSDLMAVPFDVQTRKVRGEAVVLERSIYGVGLSTSGTLAYRPVAGQSQLVLAGGGTEQVIRADLADYETPRFSPDGRRIVVSIVTAGGVDIWVQDLSNGTFTRLVTSGFNRAPEWSPDGKRVLFKSTTYDGRSGGLANRTPILWMPVDGSARADTLFVAPAEVNEAILSPDARWLVLRTAPVPKYPRDIFAVDLTGDRTLQPMATGPSSETMPRISPNGKWLAYQSDQSGRSEVYVRPFPGAGARVQVSNNGGGEPMWDRTGTALFYIAPEGHTSVSVSAGADFSVGERTLVLATTNPAEPTHQSYDIAPDGRHFLLLRRSSDDSRAIVVHNWRREVREKMQTVRR
jgi:eukaryotic-like serine/threonine-protein kinase